MPPSRSMVSLTLYALILISLAAARASPMDSREPGRIRLFRDSSSSRSGQTPRAGSHRLDVATESGAQTSRTTRPRTQSRHPRDRPPHLGAEIRERSRSRNAQLFLDGYSQRNADIDAGEGGSSQAQTSDGQGWDNYGNPWYSAGNEATHDHVGHPGDTDYTQGSHGSSYSFVPDLYDPQSQFDPQTHNYFALTQHLHREGGSYDHYNKLSDRQGRQFQERSNENAMQAMTIGSSSRSAFRSYRARPSPPVELEQAPEEADDEQREEEEEQVQLPPLPPLPIVHAPGERHFTKEGPYYYNVPWEYALRVEPFTYAHYDDPDELVYPRLSEAQRSVIFHYVYAVRPYAPNTMSHKLSERLTADLARQFLSGDADEAKNALEQMLPNHVRKKRMFVPWMYPFDADQRRLIVKKMADATIQDADDILELMLANQVPPEIADQMLNAPTPELCRDLAATWQLYTPNKPRMKPWQMGASTLQRKALTQRMISTGLIIKEHLYDNLKKKKVPPGYGLVMLRVQDDDEFKEVVKALISSKPLRPY
ncbi:hypothetical protein CBS101457_003008 [Exobasidium rhododendri]|nr:hypothetical protein CBS101457_003008 [Exobasidium rhododendri]